MIIQIAVSFCTCLLICTGIIVEDNTQKNKNDGQYQNKVMGSLNKAVGPVQFHSVIKFNEDDINLFSTQTPNVDFFPSSVELTPEKFSADNFLPSIGYTSQKSTTNNFSPSLEAPPLKFSIDSFPSSIAHLPKKDSSSFSSSIGQLPKKFSASSFTSSEVELPKKISTSSFSTSVGQLPQKFPTDAFQPSEYIPQKSLPQKHPLTSEHLPASEEVFLLGEPLTVIIKKMKTQSMKQIIADSMNRFLKSETKTVEKKVPAPVFIPHSDTSAKFANHGDETSTVEHFKPNQFTEHSIELPKHEMYSKQVIKHVPVEVKKYIPYIVEKKVPFPVEVKKLIPIHIEKNIFVRIPCNQVHKSKSNPHEQKHNPHHHHKNVFEPHYPEGNNEMKNYQGYQSSNNKEHGYNQLHQESRIHEYIYSKPEKSHVRNYHSNHDQVNQPSNYQWNSNNHRYRGYYQDHRINYENVNHQDQHPMMHYHHDKKYGNSYGNPTGKKQMNDYHQNQHHQFGYNGGYENSFDNPTKKKQANNYHQNQHHQSGYNGGNIYYRNKGQDYGNLYSNYKYYHDKNQRYNSHENKRDQSHKYGNGQKYYDDHNDYKYNHGNYFGYSQRNNFKGNDPNAYANNSAEYNPEYNTYKNIKGQNNQQKHTEEYWKDENVRNDKSVYNKNMYKGNYKGNNASGNNQGNEYFDQSDHNMKQVSPQTFYRNNDNGFRPMYDDDRNETYWGTQNIRNKPESWTNGNTNGFKPNGYYGNRDTLDYQISAGNYSGLNKNSLKGSTSGEEIRFAASENSFKNWDQKNGFMRPQNEAMAQKNKLTENDDQKLEQSQNYWIRKKNKKTQGSESYEEVKFGSDTSRHKYGDKQKVINDEKVKTTKLVPSKRRNRRPTAEKNKQQEKVNNNTEIYKDEPVEKQTEELEYGKKRRKILRTNNRNKNNPKADID